MPAPIIDTFFALLRYSLGSSAVIPGTYPGSPFTEPLTAEQWKAIFSLSKKQSLLGVIYGGIKRLPAELQPPADLMQQWTLVARRIMATNNLMNATAAKLTQMFAEKGRKTVILEGQANALLYPDPYLRQAGDIDILVEGGRKRVLKLLKEMDLLEGAENNNIHAHLQSKCFGGVSVEVHFAPTYSFSPLKSWLMQKFLSSELNKATEGFFASEGFFVPPKTFALVMQLSHLRHHFFFEGVGLRQLVDYYLLLRNSSDSERKQISSYLKKFGLYHMTEAVMWIMMNKFALPENQLLCALDERRGRLLYDAVMEGGNFGKYSKETSLPLLKRWIANRLRAFKRFWFDPSEIFWHEIRYIAEFFIYMPKRIRHRKISVRKI